MQVIDYKLAGLSPTSIVHAGYHGVMRYLAPTPNPKVITLGEYHSLLTAGLSVGLVFESTGSRALAGSAAGRSDAILANRMATNLGYSADRTIYYAIDFDASADAHEVIPYFAGLNQGTSRPVRGYGPARTISALMARGFSGPGWQAAGWRHGQDAHGIALMQRVKQVVIAGVTVDVNDCLMADWGQSPKPQLKEDDVNRIEGVYQYDNQPDQWYVAGGYKRHIADLEEVTELLVLLGQSATFVIPHTFVWLGRMPLTNSPAQPGTLSGTFTATTGA